MSEDLLVPQNTIILKGIVGPFQIASTIKYRVRLKKVVEIFNIKFFHNFKGKRNFSRSERAEYLSQIIKEDGA